MDADVAFLEHGGQSEMALSSTIESAVPTTAE